MKNQFLLLTLAAALLAGCTKTEVDNSDRRVPATHISAMAQGKGDISVDTKAPVTGTSMDGLTADVYASTYDISGYKGSLAATFSGVYGHGTMTFGTDYVRFDASDFDGLNGGSTLLPSDGREIYMYGFYPKGWTSVVDTPVGSINAYENLCYIFDGKTDVMSSWLTSADDVKIKGNDADLPDRATLTFQHLLTRYTIRVKANDATSATRVGRVKSVKIKDLDKINSAWCDKSSTVQPMSLGCKAHPTTTTPTAFYKLTGANISSPTYSDTKFEAADYATSQPLTTTFANACYTMVAPIDVMDADPLTPELTLEVVTIDDSDTETTAEVPISLLQDKFPAVDGTHLTRGYSIAITLNFRAGMIQAIASVEEWKEYGNQNLDIDRPSTRVKIGELRDGGVVYHITDTRTYKVVSIAEAPTELWWDAKGTYVIGSGAHSTSDAQGNAAAIKAYYEANKGGTVTESTFEAAFPAAAYCYNYQGKGGTDAKGTWYLPAKNDLQYLWCAFNDKAPISWETGNGAANSVPADAAAQTKFNKYLTDAGGAALTATTAGYFWSSTEVSSNTTSVWCLNFFNGNTGMSAKNYNYFIRCIKNIAPPLPPPPAVGDLKDGGIIYWVDPTDVTKYKIFSLTEGSNLTWSAKNTYVLGFAGRDETDGRNNRTALRSYSTAHTGDSDGTTKTTGVFASDFPAAAYCEAMNKGSVTGWYLPASDELIAFFTTYNANKSVFDAVLATNSGTAMTAGDFWSSTEISTSNTEVWSVSSSIGRKALSGKDSKSYPVRCFKSTLPPTPPPFAIGDLKDGGIVYEATDAKTYKVFSLPQGSNLAWAASDTYVLGAGGGQDATDGKKNMSAIKAYFAANTATVGSVFSVAFPAAAYCDAMNTGGVKGWYLPASDELKAFYTAYTANKTVLDKALTDNSGTAISADGGFWSGPEDSYNSSFACYLSFSNGNASTRPKSSSNYVRCVKSLPLPPPPPAIGDLKDGGIVYSVDPADPTSYKVFSLTQGSSLKWSAQKTYVLGATGQDATDGKKNMSAIKAYSTAHTGDSDATTKTTGVLATDFPAAAFCDALNTGGVAGWYLPAKDELTAFYTAYNANKTVLDAAITANSGTAMASGNFWSSTELSSYASFAWFVSFSYGNTNSGDKGSTNYVRCVRAM